MMLNRFFSGDLPGRKNCYDSLRLARSKTRLRHAHPIPNPSECLRLALFSSLFEDTRNEIGV
jgi:hypothetical protein